MLTLLAILFPGLVGLGLWFWAHQRWPRHAPMAIGAGGAAVALLLVLAGGLWWQGRELEAAEAEARAGALVRDSLEAVADTIRRHYLSADSARTVAERRAVQAEIERDSVDALLDTESRVRARLQARIASVDTTAGAVVTQDSTQPDVRFARWPNLRAEPLTISAQVSVPPAPDTARIRMRVRIDPVNLTVRLGCERLDGPGVDAARVSVEGPPWLDIDSLDGRADPDVCNPPPPPPPGLVERLRIAAPYAGAAFVVGLVGGVVFGG